MSYSKLIHDYLDGELDSVSQDSLFQRLASDSDMRTEFSQQMKLHAITQNDMNTISPPMDSTNVIFSALGFSIPSAEFAAGGGAALAMPRGAYFASFGSAVRKVAPYAITTLVTTVITALILFWLFDKYFSNKDDFSSTSGINSNVPVVTSYMKSAATAPAQPVQNAGISGKDIERIYSKAFNDAFDKYVKMTNSLLAANSARQSGNLSASSDNDDLASRKVSFERKRDFTLQNTILSSDYGNKDISYSKGINHTAPELPFFVLNDNNDEQTKFGLELKSFNLQSNPGTGLKSASNPWFNNMSAGLTYNINKNHSIGFTVGQESFAQTFTNLADGIVFTIRQNPILFWYGLNYKISLPDLLYANVLYPYASVMLGGTTVGPTGRVQAGLTFKPDKRVTLYLGGEASTLYYNVQNNIYNTTKYGVTYGIGIHY